MFLKFNVEIWRNQRPTLTG